MFKTFDKSLNRIAMTKRNPKKLLAAGVIALTAMSISATAARAGGWTNTGGLAWFK